MECRDGNFFERWPMVREGAGSLPWSGMSTPSETVKALGEALARAAAPGTRCTVRETPEGLEFTVSKADMPLAEEHPELYGTLLSMNEQIERGAALLLLTLALLAGVSLAVGKGLVDRVGPFEVEDLQGWQFYVPLWLLGLGVWGWIDNRIEQMRYTARRSELADLAARAKVSRSRLLARIEGDDAVDDVAKYIKLDRDEF